MVWLAHDVDSDTVHVYDGQKFKNETIAIVASGIRARGKDIPCAYPHDGEMRDRSSSKPMATLYRDEGVNMLDTHATFESGGTGVEAGIMMMLDRMRGGRFKVRKDLDPWWSEFRQYHRKDGVIVKRNDHLLDATRYAMMALLYAESPDEHRNRWAPIQYSYHGIR